ncbi:hypothetical protein EC973_003751 [Apophysomyces ossiformis]|uniref:Uncharacterized protein n=1 Tax=Apophysomyces ossiformis TaxID=679940 RepID=A0A8H7BHK7_9FUNG|nr:hypothetical protein EC973_003751 [Apophysomyces ossiformis]
MSSLLYTTTPSPSVLQVKINHGNADVSVEDVSKMLDAFNLDPLSRERVDQILKQSSTSTIDHDTLQKIFSMSVLADSQSLQELSDSILGTFLISTK